jgi:lysophospholipase L1-like esterase
VPCAAGDLIYVWKDVEDTNHLVQSTAGNRFTARQDGSGKWYADGTGGGCWMVSSTLAVDRGQFAVYMNAEYLRAGTGSPTTNNSAQWSFGTDLVTYLASSQDGSLSLTASSNGASFGNIPKVIIRPGIARYAWIGSTTQGIVSNERYTDTSGSAMPSETVTGFYVNIWFGLSSISLYSDVQIRTIVIYSGVDHGTTEITAVQAWSDIYGAPTPIPSTGPLVVCFGDSRTAGVCPFGSSKLFSETFPGRLATDLVGKAFVVNWGIPGASCATLDSTYRSDIAALLSGRSLQTNIVVVFAGVNPTAWVVADFNTLCDNLRIDGWKVVVSVEPPSDGVGFWNPTTYGTYQSAQQTSSPAHTDAISDPTVNSHVSAVPHEATYTDGLHWTGAGDALLEAPLAAAVLSLIPSGGPFPFFLDNNNTGRMQRAFTGGMVRT